MVLDGDFLHLVHVTDEILGVPASCVAFCQFCVKNEVGWGLCGSTVYISKTKMFSVQTGQKMLRNADVHLVFTTRDIDLCKT